MTKLSKSHQSSIRYPIDFCLKTGKVYGENAKNFKGYMKLLCKIKVIIFIDPLSNVSADLKAKIWIDIGLFILYFMICLQIYMTFFLFNTNSKSIM